ncbi:MAG: hypothetical protein AB1551_08375 [Actinomycetota bacterium]
MAQQRRSLGDEAWVRLLGGDPRSLLLKSGEPAARWVTLTKLLGRPEGDPEVLQAHEEVLADAGTRSLIDRIPDWEVDTKLSGHNAPGFAPNLLNLLADMGLRAGDDPAVERLLDQMLEHQDADGRFASYGTSRATPEPIWGALLCDAHAVTEVLVRFGRWDDPRTSAALERMEIDLARTDQGRAWPCVPGSGTGFRGPGRKTDFCPQVTLEALRTFARLPARRRPRGLLDVARTSLRAWRVRGEEKPYVFGHGVQFKTVKWPTSWYDVHMVLDTLSRFPGLWRGPRSRPEDRRALAELAACMVAYNVGPDGRVTPRSCYRGFEGFSFGQKKVPSAFATARLAAVLRRLDDLAPEIRAVDVRKLTSSKGGSGTAVPPKVRPA